jgi:hypothetical protein
LRISYSLLSSALGATNLFWSCEGQLKMDNARMCETVGCEEIAFIQHPRKHLNKKSPGQSTALICWANLQQRSTGRLAATQHRQTQTTVNSDPHEGVLVRVDSQLTGASLHFLRHTSGLKLVESMLFWSPLPVSPSDTLLCNRVLPMQRFKAWSVCHYFPHRVSLFTWVSG